MQEQDGSCQGSVPECSGQSFAQCERMKNIENKPCEWIPAIDGCCLGGFTAHGTGPDALEITGGSDGLFGAFGQLQTSPDIGSQFSAPDPDTGDVTVSIPFDIELCFYPRESLFN